MMTLFLATFWSASASGMQIAVVARDLLPAQRGADEEFDDPVLHWENRLRAYNLRCTFIPRNRLSGDLGNYDLVILPDLPELSASERDGVLNYLRAGGNVILTGRTGESTVDRDGRGLAAELGLDFVEVPVERSTSSWWAIMDQPGMLSAGIPRMQRISVETPAPAAVARTSATEAFWLPTTARNPDYNEAGAFSALQSGTHGRGRFVWMGFPLDHVGGDLPSSDAFYHLLGNSLDFFRSRPTLQVGPWPYPHSTAMIVSMDVEEQFGNIMRVDAVPNLPAITYFILTYPADLYRDVLREMVHEGRYLADVAIHGDNHDVFRGQAAEKQILRLGRTREFVEEVVGKPAVGFRPPEEAYDHYTLEALIENNYDYLLANNNPDRGEPQVASLRDREIVQFTMMNQDDVKLITMAGRPPPEEVLEGYIRDMDSIFRREALYIKNFHSQILATAEYIGLLEDVIAYAESRGAWITNCVEMMNWWLNRRQVELVVTEKTDRQLRFDLHNRGSDAVEDLAVQIWLPSDFRAPRIESPPGGRRILEYQEDGNRLNIRIPLLLPDDTRTYQVLWRD